MCKRVIAFKHVTAQALHLHCHDVLMRIRLVFPIACIVKSVVRFVKNKVVKWSGLDPNHPDWLLINDENVDIRYWNSYVPNNSDNKLQSDHLKNVKYTAGDLVRHSLLRAVNMKSIVL